MLTFAEPKEQRPPLEERDDPFDWNGRLSLETIRVHTKTGDVPGVTDEQLRMYRQAAVEAAELYTGMLLSGTKTITEPVTGSPRIGQSTFKHKLKYPTASGYVYLYGTLYHNPVKIPVQIGQTTVRIPVMGGGPDMTNCCLPMSCGGSGQMLTYIAGYPTIDKVPAGIVLGIMQFLAWVVEHPGDELLTMRNRLDARGGAGVYGTNNIAMASGAIETWRMYDPEAI